MQNSAVNSFSSWVNPSNFSSNASSHKSQWEEYQNLAADFFLKKNSNIYNPSAISQLAAHSNYLEKMSNLTAAVSSNDMQSLSSTQLHTQSHLPDLNNELNMHRINDKCPHHPNEDRSRYSCEICVQQYSINLNSKDIKNMQTNSNQLNHFTHQPTPNSEHGMLSNNLSNSTSHNSQSKQQSNGLSRDSSNSYSEQNGNTSSSSSGSGRKCLNKGSFLCTVCMKSFTQKGNLKTHQLIHAGLKPFVCQVCGKAFTQKGNVDTHMKIHTGEKKSKKGRQSRSDSMNKDRFKNDSKNQMNQRQKPDLNNSTNLMNSNQQDQSFMDRLLPTMHTSLINSFNRNDEHQFDNVSMKSNNHHQLNNGNSPINFSNSASASSASNWSNLTNNLSNNLTNDNFANLANYNSFTHQQMNLLNQNGKHSPIQNLSMQQQLINLNQISNNYNDFPLLQ